MIRNIHRSTFSLFSSDQLMSLIGGYEPAVCSSIAGNLVSSTLLYKQKTREMSSLAGEWQLKTSENSIKYIIDIKKFDKKVKTFRTEESICSKKFKVGGSTFGITIYPGGKSGKYKGYVSVFLFNCSDWRVKAKATFSIQNKGFQKHLQEDVYQPLGSNASGWGLVEFIHHDRCKKDDLLSDSGTFSLQTDIELLEEEVLQNRDLTEENVNDARYEKLMEAIDNRRATRELEETVDNLKANMKNMESESARQTNELKKMIQDLTLIVTNNLRPVSSHQRRSSEVECPVCM